MVCSKFKSPFPILGRQQKECDDILVKKLNVNEEYKEAFRTNSYIEICSKFEVQLASQPMDTPSSIPLYLHLSESVLEPGQEALAHIIGGSKLHPLLIDYFKITTEACNLCDLLLQSVHQIRVNHHIIERVINQRQKGLIINGENQDFLNDQRDDIFLDLATFAMMKNPLSAIRPLEFHDMQKRHNTLLYRLTLQCRKIQRRIKRKRGMKKVVGYTVVVAYTALTFTLLALAFHTIIGIVVAPALVTCSLGFLKPNKRRMVKASSMDRIGAQLDVAAKGVYILINDFNTVSRLVVRLYDEIEHSKAMADMCVRNGKIEVMKEVVREFGIEDSCFSEQLEELEKHIYLCFLTINRSRRLVVQELMHGSTGKSTTIK